MVRVLLSLLCANECSGGGAMVSVGYVHSGHGGKQLRDALDVGVVVDDPERVAETVELGRVVILGRALGVFGYDSVHVLVVGVGKEHRLDVGVVHAHMLHAVFLLVAAGQLVLLDLARHVVVDIGADHEAVLRLAVHCLGVDVVAFLAVLHKPAFVLEHLKVLCGLLVDFRIVFVRAFGEVDLRLDDVVERLLVPFSFGASLGRVQHVVWARLHLLNVFLRWADAFEWFDLHD